MFWGLISRKYGRHTSLFWEKDWETIIAGSYASIILPRVEEILRGYPELQFQQDNAKGHSATFTQQVLRIIGITPLFWPTNSPDLNPIETIWNENGGFSIRTLPGSTPILPSITESGARGLGIDYTR